MTKSRGRRKAPQDEEAVLSLELDSSSPGLEPREATSADVYHVPCSFKGLTAGASGGALGMVFGFGGYWMNHRLKGTFRGSLAEGLSSAKNFAIMGGLYAAVGCFMQRLRRKDDAWNGAASGCATGLALGWGNGPLGALQSCAMLGVFSYIVDGLSKVQPAAAAPNQGWARTRQERRLEDWLDAGVDVGPAPTPSLDGALWNVTRLVLAPAMPLVAGLAPCRQCLRT